MFSLNTVHILISIQIYYFFFQPFIIYVHILSSTFDHFPRHSKSHLIAFMFKQPEVHWSDRIEAVKTGLFLVNSNTNQQFYVLYANTAKLFYTTRLKKCPFTLPSK